MALYNGTASFAVRQKSDITVFMIETKIRKVISCSRVSRQSQEYSQDQISPLLRQLDASGIPYEELYFAVPDIHGRSDIAAMVVTMLESIKTKNVVFLGDYVDRMPDPLGVVRAVSQAKLRNPTWQMLLGNHESVALEAFAGSVALDEENSIFKLCTPAEVEECCKIFNALPVYFETSHLLFVHGGVFRSFNRKIEDIPHDELLWTYGVASSYRGKTIVRGHEIHDVPTEFENNIATQTLAWGDNSPFCVSIVANNAREQKLFGWIEIDLSGTNEINLIVCDRIFEERKKVGT